jgi:spore germination cell wall hydrolase CwlJ-like protein
VRTQAVDDSLSTEERCLASAVYFEAKGESLAGQLAVARVILARANSGRFPSTLCGVIFQKGQFSFVRGTSLPSIQMDSKHWRNAVAISNIALDNTWESPVEGALFFHARHVSPGWRLTRIGSVDNHIFYR